MNRRRAFTLLELLLATTLAAMLMALILTFSSSIRRAQATLVTDSPARPEIGQFERLLQRDLALADDIQPGKSTLTIDGYSRLDRTSQECRQGPTRVFYRLMPVGTHRYLVRQQSELDSRTNRESQMEMVLAGVKDFSLKTTKPETKDAATTQPSTIQPAQPTSFWLSVDWEDSTIPPVRRLILLQ